jgi:hypothetical protein
MINSSINAYFSHAPLCNEAFNLCNMLLHYTTAFEIQFFKFLFSKLLFEKDNTDQHILVPQMLDMFQGIFDLLIPKLAPVFPYQL